MNTTLLNTIRTSKGFSRSVAYLISIALIALVVERTVYYVLLENDIVEKENVVQKINRVAPHKARLLGLSETKTQRQRQNEKSNDTKLSEAVVNVQDTLDVLAFNLINKNDNNIAQDKLIQLYSDLKKYDAKALTDFAKTEAHIEKHQLADIIKQRHIDMVENYQNEMKTLLGNLNTIQSTDNMDSKLEAVLAARKQLEDKQLKRSQQPFDPNNLPFKSAKPNKNNKPKTSADDFVKAGLFNTPYQQYAALGDFRFDKLAGASNPEYLAESDEVVISDSIKAKAQELNYDPVTIYHWVLNNVEWLPTWGSMQDADITLGSLKGNAFDIASLHIALLRASKIPARYVHGTIEVPEDKYRNWVGGFNSIDAAGNFSSSGGIPTTAILIDGKIKTIRMEHIWVEAAIDYAPSRGAINKDADSWVQMDSSFKQYEYKVGLDAAALTGVDGKVIGQELIDSGTNNKNEDWISGLNSQIIEDSQKQAQQAIEDYINNNLNNPSAADIIGGQKIILESYPVLASSLQNPIKVIGARYAKLSTNLQNRIHISLGADIFGDPINTIDLSWVKVNNHKVTVSFKPATASDEQVLESYLPTGTIDSLDQYPSSLPVYTINVIPELKINGTVLLQGASTTLGSEVDLGFTVSRVGSSPRRFKSPIISGSFLAITAVGGSVSIDKLKTVKNRLTQTNLTIDTGTDEEISALDDDTLLGDMFYSGSLIYFSQNSLFGHESSLQDENRVSLLPSIGTYGSVPKVSYFFGFPSSISPGGIEMDLDSISIAASNKDNNVTSVKNYLLQLGMLGSILEHAVPEQMFSDDPLVKTEGVSAVKLIGKANLQGQRIYHITSANQNTVLPNIHYSSDVMSEIRSSLSVGKEVIAHTDEITINGWTGAGYIIYDPEVGDGAYKISGGLNGGFFKNLKIKALFILGMWKSFSKNHPVIAKSLGGSIGLIIGSIISIIDLLTTCKNTGIALGIAAVMIMWNLMFLGLNIMLVASGVGAVAIFALAGIEWYLENQFKNMVKGLC